MMSCTIWLCALVMGSQRTWTRQSMVCLHIYYSGKKSLQPSYSWDWSAVRSCDIMRHRLPSATRVRDPHGRHRGSRRYVEPKLDIARYHMIELQINLMNFSALTIFFWPGLYLHFTAVIQPYFYQSVLSVCWSIMHHILNSFSCTVLDTNVRVFFFVKCAMRPCRFFSLFLVDRAHWFRRVVKTKKQIVDHVDLHCRSPCTQ